MGIQHHFQQYFSYIVAVNFIGWKKPTNLPKVDKHYHMKQYQVQLSNEGDKIANENWMNITS